MKVISQYIVDDLNAGPKAKVDIENILLNNYNAKVKTIKIKNDLHNKKNLFFFKLKKLFFIIKNFYTNDIVVYQLPFNKKQRMNIRAKKSIGIIHDINGLRDLNDDLLNKEIKFYQNFDVIISHNSIMTEFLIENGVKVPIVDLNMFDYLVSKKDTIKEKKSNKNKEIAFAGNFNKALFLNELEEDEMKFNVKLYGVGKYNEKNAKLNYCGSYSPDELPLNIEADLGLVWDGNVNNDNMECNNFLNYTKYNNPHKLSCYIAAGLPVIVWEKAACSKFVKENNIGYVISSIYDINDLDYSDLEEKIKNVKKIQENVINGYYTITAINKALDIINNKK